MEWFIVGDGIQQEETEAMDATAAKMEFIERYDLPAREHDFVRAFVRPEELVNARNLTLCTECRKLFPFHETRSGMCFACHDAVYDRAFATRERKPVCQLTGEDGNVFSVITRVRRCLEEDGQPERAKEWVDDAT